MAKRVGDVVQGMEALENNQSYIWRITGVFVNQSERTGSLFISMNGKVVVGPSQGQEAQFPILMISHPEKPEKEGEYALEAARKLSDLTGIDWREVELPEEAGEITPTLEFARNKLIEAKAKFRPAKGDYAEHFEVGKFIRRVEEEELSYAYGDDDNEPVF